MREFFFCPRPPPPPPPPLHEHKHDRKGNVNSDRLDIDFVTHIETLYGHFHTILVISSDSYCSLNCLQNSLPGVNILIEPSSKYTINETNTHTLSSRKLRDKVVALMSHFFLVTFQTSLTKMKPPTLKLFIDVK